MRIYTDASTRANISGLGYIATNSKNIEIYKSGIVIDQKDNNTAELLAILYAIDDTENFIQPKEKVTILTDSTYAINAIRYGTVRKEEEPLVHKIQDMMTARDYNLFHVKGHCQDGTTLSHFNKKADKMSKIVRKQYEKEIKEAKKQKLLRHIKKNFYGV